MAPGSAVNQPTFEQQRALIRMHMEQQGVTQAELGRMIGRTAKHVNAVLNGRSGTWELDYWAWCLGQSFKLTMVPRDE